MKDRRKRYGDQGEIAAAAFLEKAGVRILQKNFRCRYGEIDLIGWDGHYYLVLEVKYRTGSGAGEASEAVDYPKQRKICLTFNYYRMKNRLDDFTPVRFDIVEVDRYGSCHWIKNAFEFIE
ncbi:MAG: YraN family protein [Eubacterium sp.]|nr:YraN family protein [Eubacterium sp.]